MFSWFKKKIDGIDNVTKPDNHWASEEIPRYPPFMKGLPAVPPEKIIETQSELIDRIVDTAIAPPDIIKRYYLSAISRFASYAHLLPASQSHHHRGAGGLIRHSIEVGLWALQSADKVLLGDAKTPLQRREMEPRWQLAVFLSALCHDAGKPMTDLIVSNKDRTTVWKPIKEDLYTWAIKNDVNAYFIDWREGRARHHTVLSNLIGDRIIGADTLEWIEEGGTELIIWMMESLTANPSPTNPIHDIVIKADQTSVERDLKSLGVAMAGYDLGVPIERYLTDIMRRFVKEGVWLVNTPGARVWNINGNIYLIWPTAGEEIAKQVREDKIPGIPRAPDGILDMLLERHIAFVREDAEPGDRFWKIAPAVLEEKIPDIKLQAIRLKDDAIVSTMPIAPIAGKVINEASPTQVDPMATDAEQTATLAKPTKTATPNHIGDDYRDEDKKDDSTKKAVNEKPVRSMPSIKPRGDKATATVNATQSAGDQLQQVEKIIEPHVGKKIELCGAVGEALKALAHDVKEGSKKWGIDVILDHEQQLLLRWPDSFAGYGLTTKAILDGLVANEWLWTDTMTPLKRVMDFELNGMTTKVIRLVRELTPVFEAEAGNAPDSANVKTETSFGMNESETRNEKLLDKSTGGVYNISTLPANAQSADADAPTLTQIIEVLVSIVDGKTPDDDGWHTIAKYQAMNQFKSKGLKVSLVQLNNLAKTHADRLVNDGSWIRFKL